MLYLLSIVFLTVFSQRNRDSRRGRGDDLCELPSDRDFNQGGFSDYAECWWWGDPHFNTFDDFSHHFQGKKDGEYYYVTQCLPENTWEQDFVPFDIVGVHEACRRRPNAPVSCVDQIKIILPDREIILDDNYRVTDSTMNDPPLLGVRYYYNVPNPPERDVKLSYYVVTRSESYGDRFVQVEVYTGKFMFVSDVIVRMNKASTRGSIEINEYYKDLVTGLCGYYDGRRRNDLTYYDSVSERGVTLYEIDDVFPIRMRDYRFDDGFGWRIINSFGNRFEVGNIDDDDKEPEVPGDCNDVLARSLCRREYDEQCRCDYDNCLQTDETCLYDENWIEDCVDDACTMVGPEFSLEEACQNAADGCKYRCRRH